MSEILRTKDRATAVGFCSVCGIIREDYEGIPITDCRCTAELRHDAGCHYIKSAGCPVSIPCDPHGLDVCLECDCTCAKGQIEKDRLRELK